MFKQVFAPASPQVTIYFEDAPLAVESGISVAAAVLGAGAEVVRSTALRHEPRGPFCHMGVCYECLMEIDGRPNQQACLIPVREGMRVRRQQGEPVFGPKGGQ